MILRIPKKPTLFRADVPPPGYDLKLLPFNTKRKLITPRLQLVHTNGASTQGSIQSSYNWALRNTWPGYIYGNPVGSFYTTIPHFQVDRDGRAAMMIHLDRQGIAAAKANPFCISFETADRGYNIDPYPTGSLFTDEQVQTIAVGLAYCAVLFKIKVQYPTTWDGNGTASHTEPFGYPYWTIDSGKPCPGNIKKQQMRDIIMPFARQIVNAWTGVTPPTGEDPDVITYQEIISTDVAPPVAEVTAGRADRWLNAALLNAMLFNLTDSDEYDQAAADKLSALLQRRD